MELDMRKRTVVHNGQVYKVKSDKIEIPDLSSMDSIPAAMWLMRNTYSKGYSKPQPLAGLGDAISLQVH